MSSQLGRLMKFEQKEITYGHNYNYDIKIYFQGTMFDGIWDKQFVYKWGKFIILSCRMNEI